MDNNHVYRETILYINLTNVFWKMKKIGLAALQSAWIGPKQ